MKLKREKEGKKCRMEERYEVLGKMRKDRQRQKQGEEETQRMKRQKRKKKVE